MKGKDGVSAALTAAFITVSLAALILRGHVEAAVAIAVTALILTAAIAFLARKQIDRDAAARREEIAHEESKGGVPFGQ